MTVLAIGEHPGVLLKDSTGSDFANISRLSEITVERLIGFREGTTILTKPECDRLNKVMGLSESFIYFKQKYYATGPGNMSIVRHNLLTEPGYSGYCGNATCAAGMPRTRFNGAQWRCICGWGSQYPDDFMKQYQENWNLK